MGVIVPEYFMFLGYLSPSAGLRSEDVPNGLAAIGKVPVEGWLQWVVLCGFFESGRTSRSHQGHDVRGRIGAKWSSTWSHNF
jgi:hypothetical protein